MSVAAPPTSRVTTAVPVVAWGTVLTVAVVCAGADAFWLTALRGAVGDVSRGQDLLRSLLRTSLMLAPFLAVAVLVAALLPGRASRASAWRSTLLLVLATTAVAVLGGTLASVADYRLQSARLEAMLAMHGSCGSACLEQQRLLTLAAHGRGLALVAGIVLLTNLAVVGWIAALRGGQLRPVVRAVPDDARADRLVQLRGLVAGLLVGSAAVHLAAVPEHVHEWVGAAIFFAVVGAAQLALAGVLGLGSRPLEPLAPAGRLPLVAAGVVSVGLIGLWLLSRTSGLPVGPEPYEAEPVGAADLVAVTLELGAAWASRAALRGRPGGGWSRHGQAVVVTGVVALTVLAVTVLLWPWSSDAGPVMTMGSR